MPKKKLGTVMFPGVAFGVTIDAQKNMAALRLHLCD